MTINKLGLETFGRLSEMNIPPSEYYSLIRKLNTLLRHDLAEKLEHEFEHLSDVATFVTTGSDARLEKGSLASPLEVIALARTDLSVDALRSTITKVIEKSFADRVSKVVEVKGLGASMLTFQGDLKKIQPGRIADARVLFGRRQALIDAQEHLGREIVSMPNDTVDRVAGLARNAKRATLEGKNRIAGEDAVHFDLETGTVFFNPSANQLSFKIGPLRLVQNKLLLEEVRHTRREKDPNFIGTLASGIRNRLDQLSEDRMVNLERASINELKNHYAFFLKLYHRSEEVYTHSHGVAVALQLDPKEIEEVAKRIQAMTDILEKLKIQKQPS